MPGQRASLRQSRLRRVGGKTSDVGRASSRARFTGLAYKRQQNSCYASRAFGSSVRWSAVGLRRLLHAAPARSLCGSPRCGAGQRADVISASAIRDTVWESRRRLYVRSRMSLDSCAACGHVLVIADQRCRHCSPAVNGERRSIRGVPLPLLLVIAAVVFCVLVYGVFVR